MRFLKRPALESAQSCAHNTGPNKNKNGVLRKGSRDAYTSCPVLESAQSCGHNTGRTKIKLRFLKMVVESYRLFVLY